MDRRKGRECAAPPRSTRAVEGEKGREGDAGSSMDHQDPHPHGGVSRAGVAAAVGDRQGNVRGVGVLYKAGARGGELSSFKRSVSVSCRVSDARSLHSATTTTTTERILHSWDAHASKTCPRQRQARTLKELWKTRGMDFAPEMDYDEKKRERTARRRCSKTSDYRIFIKHTHFVGFELSSIVHRYDGNIKHGRKSWTFALKRSRSLLHWSQGSERNTKKEGKERKRGRRKTLLQASG
ncbi:hypothetical protein X777_13219 [Ooceraea biroi]|uniref:Uncharacterized protein n=1 Tax=Ooceraea biroi TaxID=2015173 RepID=A0A026W094_OOCBI|nr:hypothetical protein X777_13219 [Ooceraea biroi]